ncbi:MAG: diguanylate cyclase [Chitinispirillales bacterium]|jgi:diguanylate cyclase (GGDEF)-like protein|nr:diguanylate cyclase [Chitinispirillales bacterium]
MNKFSKKLITPLVLVVLGLSLLFIEYTAAKIFSGLFLGVGFGGALSVGAFKKRKRNHASKHSETRDNANLLPLSAETDVAQKASAVQAQALGAAYRREQWHKTEATVDEILDMFITFVQSRFSGCNTIAVFFPAKDDSYMLRRFRSKSEFVNKDALLIPRCGILGSLITEGLRPFYEPNFTNQNATLYYYDKDHSFKPEERIRSIMLSPIKADNLTRGILLVDSTQESAFSSDDQAFLSGIAALLGTSVYHVYLNTGHSLDYQQLVAMSSIEKEFWTNLEFNAVMDKMRDIIPYAIPCDRLTISLKDENKKDSATVVRVSGQNSEELLNLNFPLGESVQKSIVSMAYSKNLSFFRNFSAGQYEIRYSEEEARCDEFASFLAVPFGVDKCKGMMFIESAKSSVFTNSNIDLLSRIGTSAGLALEKIFILSQADALAKHDGLTGLFNHRHFQKIIETKLSASTRYNEPLSLVLCDIDFFKKLNDTYGHPFGDIVLKGVAAKLESSIRMDIDAAARYGGEEFVLILDKTNAEAAHDTVDRIRQSIEAMVFKTTDGRTEVKTSMSFGIAAFPKHGQKPAELIKNADTALYEAKKTGRNRVVVY